MDIDKKQIMVSLIRMIDHISDKEYLRRAWIKGEAADFDETVCLFFETCDPILAKYKDFGISEYQNQILKNFRDAFEIFSDNNGWPEEFIDTPQWEKIMEMAKEVLKAFNYNKKF
jgi:hypothetical protein